MRNFILLSALVFIIAFSQASKGPEYRIIYTMLMNEDYTEYEIYSMNPDGSDKRNISNSKGVDWAYYASGNKVYFVSDRDTTSRAYSLYEMDAFGNNVRRITDYTVPDAWVSSRKNGEELLVVQATSYFDTEIWLIDKNGKKLSQLTDNNVRDTDPVFSPDGKSIAFRTARGLKDPKGHEELWIMDENGKNARQLSFYPEGKEPPSRSLYKAGPPIWSPDGKWITFISHREGRYNIFKVGPDGSDFARLTSNDMYEGYHSWSPDGSKIVFDSDQPGQYDIYIMNADGSNVQRLTSDDKYEQCPVFVRVK